MRRLQARRSLTACAISLASVAALTAPSAASADCVGAFAGPPFDADNIAAAHAPQGLAYATRGMADRGLSCAMPKTGLRECVPSGRRLTAEQSSRVMPPPVRKGLANRPV